MLTALFVAGFAAPAVALPDPDPDDVTAVATLQQVASATTVAAGETFTYTLTIGCSSITDNGCRDAVLSDVVPAPFEIVDVVVGGGVNTADPPAVEGNNVTVSWTTPLGDGTVGILDATTGIVEIIARLPEDVSHDFDGVPVLNDAVIEGTNFVDADDQVEVTPVVPLSLATAPTKGIIPTSAINSPGTPVTAALGATNGSNATVESLTIQDPTTPDRSPNPFDYLGFAGFGDVTVPEGATATVYEVYVDGAWVEAPGGALPGGVDPADVKGTRVTFSGAIPTGATASVDIDLETTELASQQPDGFVVTNTVQSEVALGPDTATGDAAADFTLLANDVQVDASKVFDPALVVAGEPSTVTIGGSNASTIALDSLTLREPSSGSFPAAYTFGGIISGIDYPAGATSGVVVYHLADGSTQEVPFADGATPAPPAGALEDVTSFEVVFEGDISPGAETTVAFTVDTDPDNPGLPATVPNQVAVVGENDGATGEATADDELFVYGEVIETYIGKAIRPSQILAVPGEPVTVSLEGGLTERPNPPDNPTGSTGSAAQVVIQDPADPVEPNDWWNAFDVTAITQTPVPADSTLTVEYYDTTDGTWKTLTGPIDGPTIVSEQVPPAISDVAGGIRYVYDYTGAEEGFPPGTDFAPHFTSELRPDGRYEPGPPFDDEQSTFVPDCAQSSATSPTPGVPDAGTTMPSEECPEVELIPADPGNADLIDKTYGTSSSGGDKSVIARSGDTIPSTLRWSTGGFSNLERVELTDIADPAGTPIGQSVFDAFNLTRVQPITPDTDPLIIYDQVQQVLLYNGIGWVDAANDPCPAGCTGQFPGMSLTAAERQSTLAVRLVFVESPDRAAASEGHLDAPPVGSGVARSFGNQRPVQLVWQLRDAKRSDGSPVLGEDLYNLTDPGVVRNTANATGYPEGGGTPISANDSDDVVIVDVPLTTTTGKNWSGGPLAVPSDPDIPADQYPTSRLTVTTRNTTPARVDQLVTTDPAPGSVTDRRDDPFQAFTFSSFVTITAPAGTQNTEVTLFCPDGSESTYTRAEALALVAATLPCDVSGIQVAYDGRIAANAAGVVTFDMRLRPFWRGTSERVSVPDAPITNTAQGVIADVDDVTGCPPPADARVACDQDSANITLEDASFGVTADKSIAPAQQEIGDFAPVTVTLAGQPTGSARTVTMTITDDDPTFWNAVDFDRVDPSWTLPRPVGRVQACYLTGGEFTAVNVAADTVGGEWTCQPLQADMPVAAAITFLDGAPADLHGLRLQFWRADGLGWENPARPVVRVPFQVVRRETLRTGGPVPTTRADQTPAPGEDESGIFWDTVEVDSQSVNVGAGPLTADDTADAQYRHVHLEARVNVEKSPRGDVRPGQVIPYTLTFTNTGEAALTNPVFADVLPTDADGPLLVFDPDRDPSVSPYTFTLSGAAPEPPNGSPLPTIPDQVEVEETGDRITFRMPEGSVLEPGQSYTITVDLMLRPGLTPDDQVENLATVTAEEPFDECVPTYDAASNTCTDNTVVQPLAVPALSTVKKVKADEPVVEPGIPQVISTANDFSCAGAADVDGFYRAPCVPDTLPGETETWRFEITNAGTLPMDRVVSIDNLPTPGDQGLIVTLPRESAWEPTFVGNVELVPTPGTPPGTTLTTYYSTESVPCTADLNPVGAACPAGAWLRLDDSVDPAQVRSLKFELDFPDELFAPGDRLTLQFRTRTTPQFDTAADFPIAWNTVSTGGAAISGDSRIPVPATEGRRVGVSYPTGPIRLAKVVTGPGAEFAPDEFPVQVTCTSAGNDLTDLPTVVLEPGADPRQVDGLPWGAECTATEDDLGQTSSIVGAAVVGGPEDEIGVVTVENVFQVGGLEITKQVASEAVDHNGDPIPYGPFQVAATCEFLGEEVFAEGYGPDDPMVSEIADGESWVLTGLPTGALCTVTETDDASASRTVITPSEVEIDDGSPVSVEVENAFDVGSLALEKVVTGEGAADFGAGPFTLHATCVLDDASGVRTVYDADVELGGDQPLQAQIDNLAAGAECTVTEPDSAGAHEVQIDPESAVVADEVVDVTVTNTFDAGALTVTKQIEGAGAELYGAGPFEVTLSCTREGPDGPVELAVPGGASRQLSVDNGYTVTYEPLLVGAVCAIEESVTGGANETEVVDAAGEPVTEITIPATEEVAAVRLFNTFLMGSVTVEKSIEGGGADEAAGREFRVRLRCEYDVDGTPTEVDVPGGATRRLSRAAGLTTTYDDLPTGAECTLTETRDGGADEVSIAPNDGDPTEGAVVVGDGTTVTLDVVNTFDPEVPPTNPPATNPPTNPPATSPPAAMPVGPSAGSSGTDLPDTGLPRAATYAGIVGLALLLLGIVLIATHRRKRVDGPR